MTARLTAGRLGLAEALILEEGIGDHGHQCVAMNPMPGLAFEKIEAKFLVHPLMRPNRKTAPWEEAKALQRVAAG